MVPDDFPAGGYVGDYVMFCVVWVVLVVISVAWFRRTRGRRGFGRLLLGNLLVFAVLAWTAVLGFETYLRWVYDQTDQWGISLTNVAWHKRHTRLNANGFRDREFTGKHAPGVERVACVGDSFTMGWGVADPADAWPQRLGALLEQKAPGRHVTLNLGRAGSGTGEEADLVASLAQRNVFERVVLGYCLNDADDLLPPEKQFTVKGLPRPTWIAPTSSFVVDFLWFHLRLKDDPYVHDADVRQSAAYEDETVWTRQVARFRRVADTCRDAHVPLDVIVFPFFSDWGEGYRFAACHEKTVEAWRRLGIHAIDLREVYAGHTRDELMVNRFDGHPSALAHDIAARAVVQRVLALR